MTVRLLWCGRWGRCRRCRLRERRDGCTRLESSEHLGILYLCGCFLAFNVVFFVFVVVVVVVVVGQYKVELHCCGRLKENTVINEFEIQLRFALTNYSSWSCSNTIFVPEKNLIPLEHIAGIYKINPMTKYQKYDESGVETFTM